MSTILLRQTADKWSDLCWEKDAFVVGIIGESLGVLVELGQF